MHRKSAATVLVQVAPIVPVVPVWITATVHPGPIEFATQPAERRYQFAAILVIIVIDFAVNDDGKPGSAGSIAALYLIPDDSVLCGVLSPILLMTAFDAPTGILIDFTSAVYDVALAVIGAARRPLGVDGSAAQTIVVMLLGRDLSFHFRSSSVCVRPAAPCCPPL